MSEQESSESSSPSAATQPGSGNEKFTELVKRIELQKGLHKYFELRTRFTSMLVKILNIVLPAHIVFLVFTEFTSLRESIPWLTPVVVELTIGGLGFVLFVTSLLTEVFKGDSRYLDHQKAIERYDDLLEEIRLNAMRKGAGKSWTSTFEQFNKRFRQISVTSPSFTDKQIERGIVYLVRSKAIKLARKENPFAGPLRTRKLAQQKVDGILEDSNDPLYGYPPTENVASIDGDVAVREQMKMKA